jgi:hypothetical protein
MNGPEYWTPGPGSWSPPGSAGGTAGDRRRWRQFLAAQAFGILACDFLRVGTVVLQRRHVLSRWRSRPGPGTSWASLRIPPAWTAQQARSLLMNLCDPAGGLKFLIGDRNSKFTAAVPGVFPGNGRKLRPLPRQRCGLRPGDADAAMRAGRADVVTPCLSPR